MSQSTVAIPFAIDAQTLSLSPGGTDAGAGPWKTFRYAFDRIRQTGGGYNRRLVTLPGVYSEEITNVPSGLTIVSPTPLAAIVRPTTTTGFRCCTLTSGEQDVTLDGLLLDAINLTNDCVKLTGGGPEGYDNTAKRIRVLRCDLRNAVGQGILLTKFVTDCVVQYNQIHDHGRGSTGGSTNKNHGVYCSAQRTLIADNDVFLNTAYGIQLYSGTGHDVDDNRVLRNRVFRNSKNPGAGGGIVVASGARNEVSNNLLWDNYRGIQPYNGALDTTVWFNTLADHAEVSLYMAGAPTRTRLQNNVVQVRPGGAAYINDATAIGTVQDHNWLSGDPRFVNPGARDYHLLGNSPCLANAVAIPGVDTDLEGNKRGTPPDQGCYERA